MVSDLALTLDLSHQPPTHLLPTHLSAAAHASQLSQLRASHCPLAATPAHATLFLTDATKPKRCELELRRAGLQICCDDDDNDNDDNDDDRARGQRVRVVNLKWLEESLEKGQPLPLDEYTVLTAYALATPTKAKKRPLGDTVDREAGGDVEAEAEAEALKRRREEILRRAWEDAAENEADPSPKRRWHGRHSGGGSGGGGSSSSGKKKLYKRYETNDPEERRGIDELLAISKTPVVKAQPPILLRKTTTEFSEEEEVERRLSSLPSWVRENVRPNTSLPPPPPPLHRLTGCMLYTHTEHILNTPVYTRTLTKRRFHRASKGNKRIPRLRLRRHRRPSLQQRHSHPPSLPSHPQLGRRNLSTSRLRR